MKMHDSIQMRTEYGVSNEEVQSILTFNGTDYYNVRFTGKAIKGRHFSLIAKDMWDGNLKKTDTIFNTANMNGLPPIESDAFEFKVIAQKISNDKLKVFFRFQHFGHEKIYESTESFDYSLRDIGTKLPIELDKAFPAFAYILPYEKDGWKMWCAVDSSGKDVERWGKEFGIKHYIIFEILFE